MTEKKDILNESVELRLSKAKNTETEPDILDALSHDRFWFVRDFVAANPNTSRSTLDNMLRDPDFRVRDEAQKNIKSRKLDNKINIAVKRYNISSKAIDNAAINIKDTFVNNSEKIYFDK